MKIAVIGSKGLPPKQGGIEHYCAEVYSRLVAAGHSVDLFARASYTHLSWRDRYTYEGIRVFSLPSIGQGGLDAFTNAALGAMIASRQDYDILHFHALGPALFSWIPHWVSPAKVVVSCHGLDWQRSKWNRYASAVIQMGERVACHCADELMVVSQDLHSYFWKTHGRETVYLPTAPASYVASDPTFAYGSSLGLAAGKYILYLGRLVPEKRPDLLLQAFQSQWAESVWQGWKLVLVGSTSDPSDFTTHLLRSGRASGNVVFTGELRGRLLSEIVRGAGLMVQPSDLEGMPLSLLEAMAEGIPVIASDIPPHQQLLGLHRGLLFSAGQVDACAAAIAWAIRHPRQMQQMAQKARRFVAQQHNWNAITAGTLELYQFLIHAPTLQDTAAATVPLLP